MLRRLRSFDGNFWSGVERLVYFVLFPALLFRSLEMKGAGPPVAMLISIGTLLAAVTLPLWIAAVT